MVLADVIYLLKDHRVRREFSRRFKDQVNDHLEQTDPSFLIGNFEDLVDNRINVVSYEVHDGCVILFEVFDDLEHVLEHVLVVVEVLQVFDQFGIQFTLF